MTPAPTTSSFFGTAVKSRAPVEETTRFLVDLDAGKARDIRSGRDDNGLGRQRLRLAAGRRYDDLPGFHNTTGAEKALDLILLEEIGDTVDIAFDALALERLHLGEIERRIGADTHRRETCFASSKQCEACSSDSMECNRC